MYRYCIWVPNFYKMSLRLYVQYTQYYEQNTVTVNTLLV